MALANLPGVGLRLHIANEHDHGDSYRSLIDLLEANVKLHFIDEHHMCKKRRDKDGFNICLTNNPSMKIITIKEKMRNSKNILLMTVHFDDAEIPIIWQPEPIYNYNSDDSIGETPINCAICPVCGKY